MLERPIYLDSSCIVKRYIHETGSEIVDEAYEGAESGDLHLTFSLWNLGEAIGVFDRLHGRGLISKRELSISRSDLISETLKLTRLESLEVVPVTSDMLTKAWTLIPMYHIYEADALQIATCAEAGCEMFLSADETLLKAAGTEGFRTINVEKEKILKEHR